MALSVIGLRTTPNIEPSHFAGAECRMDTLRSGSKPVSLFYSVTHSEGGLSVPRASKHGSCDPFPSLVCEVSEAYESPTLQ
jgi:hypothetical protein